METENTFNVYITEDQNEPILIESNIKPMDDENYKDYIKELISLKIIDPEMEKILLFLVDKIDELEK